MATITGTLSVVSGESSLAGKLLALEGAPDPLGDATNFLAGLGFGNNSRINATGENGFLGEIQVFYITGATAALENDAPADGLESIADDAPGTSPVVAKKKRKKSKKAPKKSPTKKA